MRYNSVEITLFKLWCKRMRTQRLNFSFQNKKKNISEEEQRTAHLVWLAINGPCISEKVEWRKLPVVNCTHTSV